MATFVAVDLVVPRMPIFNTVITDFVASSAITGTTLRIGWVFQVPKSGTLRRFHFRIHAAGTPIGLRASFQDLDAAMNADLTEDQYRDVSSGSVTAGAWITPGILSSDGTDGGTKRTVTHGQFLACVVRGLGAGNVSLSLPQLQGGGYGGHLLSPYTDYHNGGSWTGHGPTCGCLLLEYDDGTYAQLDGAEIYPFHAFTDVAFGSGSTPDERGMIWTPDFTCKIKGLWYKTNSTEVHNVVFYTGTTATETLTIDPDYRTTTNLCRRPVYFAAEHTLTAGVTYRFVVKPTSGSSISLGQFTVADAAYMAAMPLGTACHLTTRTDGGAFSETPTIRPWMGLIISAIQTDPGGGGAVLRHPGMTGGLNA